MKKITENWNLWYVLLALFLLLQIIFYYCFTKYWA